VWIQTRPTCCAEWQRPLLQMRAGPSSVNDR
jgi:hypothetical protein